jgi:hypothetical protein
MLILWGCSRVSTTNVDDGSSWWKHVEYLASDELAGRYTGSDGYLKAARYVAGKFQEAGLQPAGTEGYLQPVEFISRKLVPERSTLEIVRNGSVQPMKIPEAVILGQAGESEELLELPLVFAGYGLTVPEANYDDYKGLPVRGAAVVLLMGGAPKTVPPLLASHYSSPEMQVRNGLRLGTRGALLLPNPKVVDLPWNALVNTILTTGLLPLPRKPDDEWRGGPYAVVRAEEIDSLLRGTGHTFRELTSLDSEGKPLPHFALNAKLRVKPVFEEAKVTSPNIVATLPGSDPQLRSEYLLISAHLDHLGTGAAVDGDTIYNGAMDNATGISALLEAARILQSSGPTKRSVLFLACTGEEEGLLGSGFFAENPTVDRAKIIADINLDMFLPLFPLKIVRAYGLRESNLASYLEPVANEMRLRIQDDPTPERNAFIRSDQYSLIKKGIPSLFLSFGYDPGSPEDKIVNSWFEQRYHAPSDDTKQPMDRVAAAQFNRLLATVARRIADAPERPAWNPGSFFKRFAQ